MTPNEVSQSIRDITIRLIKASLVDRQNYPITIRIGGQIKIGISGAPDLGGRLSGHSVSRCL